MTRSLSIILIPFFFLSFGCRKPSETDDKCKDLVCANEGTCYRGTCKCPVGYGGDYCETILPGAVVGNITPYSIALNVVTDIALTATNTTDSYHTYVGPGGGFIFERVPPGNYTLRIKTNSAYYPPPPDISVTVKAEDTTFAGIITISYSAAVQTGTLLFSVNGGPDHILNGGDFEAGGMSYGLIRLSGIESGGTQSGYYKFELHVSGVAEPGNYSVQNASYLEVRHYTSGSLDGYWKAGNGYSNATVNISSFDTTTKKFSGTFNGTLSPISHSVDSIQISGSFTDVYGG